MKLAPKQERIKILREYFDILLNYKWRKAKAEKALEELNNSLSKKRQIKIFNSKSELGSELRSELRSELGSELRSELGSELWNELGNELGNELWNELWNELGSELGNELGSELWNELGSELRSELRNELWNELGSELFEYYEIVFSPWISKIADSKIIKGNKNKVEALDSVIKSGIGYLLISKTTIYALKFPRIQINDNKRLHSLEKPALVWGKDKSYYINGVKFEKDLWGKAEKMTAKEVFAIENMEQRREVYEIMDKSKMLDLDYKTLDKVKDDGYGYSMRVIEFNVNVNDNVNDIDLRFLNCFCPTTGREYYLETREKKCWDAKLKSFGLDKKFNIEK